jgi:hypothetical protein
MKIAAITMMYNEPDFLPVWVRHYARELGADNCFVIDHGSDDGSAKADGVNFLRFPRSPQDNNARATLVSGIAGFLLGRYDAVIYSDVDEIVFADPRLYPSLKAFCAANPAKVISAHGFDVLYMRDEAAYDPGLPVLRQRSWLRFAAAMCKPVIIRKPVTWAPGFHCTTDPIMLGDLYLFHLRHFDFGISSRRLARTRAQAWADPVAAPWQKISDAENKDWFNGYNDLRKRDDVALHPDLPPLSDVMTQFLLSQIGREAKTYKTVLNIDMSEVWKVPEAFREIF